MNNFHSPFELNYKKRLITPFLKDAIRDFPVVVLYGARQVGKSTLLLKEFIDFKYISFDEYDNIRQAKSDPYSLWIGADRVILDEAQRVLELFSAVKIEVDRSPSKRFIISGSSNLLLMEKVI